MKPIRIKVSEEWVQDEVTTRTGQKFDINTQKAELYGRGNGMIDFDVNLGSKGNTPYEPGWYELSGDALEVNTERGISIARFERLGLVKCDPKDKWTAKAEALIKFIQSQDATE